MFVYAATYASLDDAEADYDTLLDLHDADLVGTYDVAIIDKDAEGKVHVTKHEKPTQHGRGPARGRSSGSCSRPRSLGRQPSAQPPVG